MGMYTGVSDAVIAAAVPAWGRGELVDSRPTPHGIENSNLFVTTRDDDGAEHRFVLTLMDAEPAPAGLAVLAALGRAGLPVPAPVLPPGADTPVRHIEDHPSLLAPRLPGDHPDTPDAHQCRLVGELLARMHAATRGMEAPGHPRDAAWLARGLREHETRLGGTARALLREGLATITDAARRSDWQRLPSGVVHGDLFRDNALFDGPRLTGVIDFHHAATAPLIFDLAVVANDWCASPDGRPDPDRLEALLRGYGTRRTLTRSERAFWPVAGALAALRFWVARLDSPRKDPDEQMRLLEAHLRRPLSPRVLPPSS